MMDLFYQGGVLFMSLLSIIGLVMITGIVLHLTKKVKLRFVKEVGMLALVIGILGQLIGLFEAFQALESMEVQVSTAMIMGGLKVSMISTLYGFLLFIIARVYALATEKWKLAE
jgi:biopolymer transport protein ExbB/TolQ